MKTKASRILAMLLVVATLCGISVPVFADTGTLIKSKNIDSDLYFWGGDVLDYTFTYADGSPGEAHIGGMNIHYINGKVAYCIEPGVESVHNTPYTGEGVASSSFWETKLTAEQRYAIQLILLYGAPNYLPSDDQATQFGYEGATQVLIWEIVLGLRHTTSPFARKNNRLYYTFAIGCDYPSYKDGYAQIVEKIAAHKTIPSFSGPATNGAPEIELTYDSATGISSATLQDTNQVLSSYNFQGSGLTLTPSGNSLTITMSANAIEDSPKLVSATGSSLNEHGMGLLIWTADDATKQTLIQVGKTDASPATAYFYVKNGIRPASLTITKTSPNGGTVASVKFQVLDSSGTELFSGTTDASGKLTVPGLTAGMTVTVKETVPEGNHCEKSSQEITLSPGENALSFTNFLITGGIVVHKTEEATGTPLPGAIISLKHSDGTLVESKTTDDTGTVRFTNVPYGSYTVSETDAPEGFAVTPDSQKVTIDTIGVEKSLGITNRLLTGSVTVTKCNADQEPLTGASFLLEYSLDGQAWKPVETRPADSVPQIGFSTKEATLTSNASGQVVYSGLSVNSQMGEILYRVTEVQAPDGYSLAPAVLWTGYLTEATPHITISATNGAQFVLPFTGDIGFMPILHGSFLMGIALLLGTISLSKHKQQKRR
ncbi:MAG: carboxypeptidase regulatory-like domain-containing protein [Clostridia bacterium]|nr:carboxypeptidase regulatory-like domain-containing protein [Clostridia bacterium]